MCSANGVYKSRPTAFDRLDMTQAMIAITRQTASAPVQAAIKKPNNAINGAKSAMEIGNPLNITNNDPHTIALMIVDNVR